MNFHTSSGGDPWCCGYHHMKHARNEAVRERDALLAAVLRVSYAWGDLDAMKRGDHLELAAALAHLNGVAFPNGWPTRASAEEGEK